MSTAGDTADPTGMAKGRDLYSKQHPHGEEQRQAQSERTASLDGGADLFERRAGGPKR